MNIKSEGEIPDPVAEAEALIDAGDPTGAVALLEERLRQGSGGPLLRITLGRALIAADQVERALEVLREAAALAPGIAEAALALGEGLLAAGHVPAAIAELQRSVRLDSSLDAAHYGLGCAWLEAGEAERAIQILSKLAPPSSSVFAARAAGKISEAEGMQRANRCAPGYVRHLFDQFSEHYDDRMLGELSYRAPVALRGLADLVLGAKRGSLDILDLGCGTGLSGAAFKDLAHRLDGVDLSPRMIAKAQSRGIYDSLAVGDLESMLRQTGAQYDLMIAADTLVYLGDLGPVFEGVHARLKQGGFFLFTAEKRAGDGYELGPKRRYRHSETYLRREAARANFEIMGLLDCSPRDEAKLPVEGLAVALQKMESA